MSAYALSDECLCPFMSVHVLSDECQCTLSVHMSCLSSACVLHQCTCFWGVTVYSSVHVLSQGLVCAPSVHMPCMMSACVLYQCTCPVWWVPMYSHECTCPVWWVPVYSISAHVLSDECLCTLSVHMSCLMSACALSQCACLVWWVPVYFITAHVLYGECLCTSLVCMSCLTSACTYVLSEEYSHECMCPCLSVHVSSYTSYVLLSVIFGSGWGQTACSKISVYKMYV